MLPIAGATNPLVAAAAGGLGAALGLRAVYTGAAAVVALLAVIFWWRPAATRQTVAGCRDLSSTRAATGLRNDQEGCLETMDIAGRRSYQPTPIDLGFSSACTLLNTPQFLL